MAGEPDQYTGATNNIRETVKWLIAALASAIVLLIGTSPLNRLASLSGLHLFIALGSVAVSLFVTGLAIKLATDILVQRTFYLGDIDKNSYLVKLIDDREKDLLPVNTLSFHKFLVDRNNNLVAMTKDSVTQIERDNFDSYKMITKELVGLCNFELARLAFEKYRNKLLGLVAIGVVSLGIFIGAVGPDNSQGKGPNVRVSCVQPSEATKPN